MGHVLTAIPYSYDVDRYSIHHTLRTCRLPVPSAQPGVRDRLEMSARAPAWAQQHTCRQFVDTASIERAGVAVDPLRFALWLHESAGIGLDMRRDDPRSDLRGIVAVEGSSLCFSFNTANELVTERVSADACRGVSIFIATRATCCRCRSKMPTCSWITESFESCLVPAPSRRDPRRREFCNGTSSGAKDSVALPLLLALFEEIP